MDWLSEEVVAAEVEAGVPPDIGPAEHRAAALATGRPCRDHKALVARRAGALPQRIDQLLERAGRQLLERAGQVPHVVPVRPTTVRPVINVPAHRVKHGPASRPIDLKSRAAGAPSRELAVGRIRAVDRIRLNWTTSWAINPAQGPAVASPGLAITPVWPRTQGRERPRDPQPTIVARM